MNAAARSFGLLAVAAHIAITASAAYASVSDMPPSRAAAGSASHSSEFFVPRLAQSTGGSDGSTGAAGGANGGGGGGDSGPGGHGGGFSLPVGAPPGPGACGAGPQLSDPTRSATPLQGVEEISKQAQTYIEQCGCATRDCIADALEAYADALEKVTAESPRTLSRLPRAQRVLPHAIRELPRIVREAAKNVRAAPNLKAAVRVLNAAIAVVHKSIELARAADPDAKAVVTRGADAVAGTLKTAATALVRADAL
jgi:hypothetical protein